MATLVLGAVGATIGGSLGGSVLGLSAAVIGRAAGATLGRVIDQRIMGAGADAVEHGRIDRFRLTGAAEGAAIPRVYGRVRVGGQVIWASRCREERNVSGGGKGAPKSPQVTQFSYSISVAVALSEGPITRIGRIWADGSEISRDSLTLRVYDGSEDQLPDALISAIEGEEAAPAFRGTAYVVIEDMDLTQFGNRVPQMSFEVVRSRMNAEGVGSPAELLRGVALVPGTGEYSLATTAVHYGGGVGDSQSANVSTLQDISDFRVSMRDLEEELPNVGAASLVVSWFGDDLRCSHCTVRPRAEHLEAEGAPIAWTVAGAGRDVAGIVPIVEERPVYGGTPGDASVVEAVRDLTSRGIEVTFYPFILMDQLEGNGLPDPYGAAEQAVLPWRGRITTELAPDQSGSADRTAAAAGEVEAFFGTAASEQFHVGDGVVTYSGPQEWSYRRFILHYAALCAAAGGVEAFCIGSEMRGLTRIRGAGDSFPAVAQMVSLAAEVRQLLPYAKISYAADWSEYYGYHPADSGNVHFNLDPLWSAPEIDFIGIDNYMPLSDWRDGEDHADSAYRNIGNLDYLRANIEGGEGFDWYYPTEEARAAQRRVPIEDGAYGEPWVFRYKDIRSWWQEPHHDRIDGVRLTTPTAWVPRSKPIRFTEFGCAAIDKGTNQPNKFLDPKSSESQLPRHSNGRRDDMIQMQYLRAMLSHWSDPDQNPVSDVYDQAMVDMDRSLAWAWDARPWPAFPDLLSFWSDGDNYGRGHWINGRSGNVPLANVIEEICRSSGLQAIDVSGVHGALRGYPVQNVQSARADLQPLLLAHGVDVAERDGVVAFFMRSDAVVWSLERAHLVPEGDATVHIERAAEADVSGRVRVQHIDAAGSFTTKVGDAVLPGGAALPIAESELPLSLTTGEGHALAERFLAEARIARDGLQTALPPSAREVRAGDLITLDGDGETYRVDRIEDAGQRRIQAVRTEKATLEPSDAVEDGSGQLRPRASLPVEAVIMDLPLLTGKEDPQAPHVAVSARPWPGSVAIYSSVADADYRLNTLVDVPSILGRTETELLAARPGLWDRGEEVVVRVAGGTLASVSEASLLAGANAMAVGSGAASGWEILQFRDARVIEPGVWGLSMRLRGQRGTEANMPASWPAGSVVALLDGGPEQLDLPPDALGLPRYYRYGAARLPLDHETYRQQTRTIRGEGLRPYAPVHLRAMPQGADLGVSWVRRSRAVGEAWDISDVPLAEASERYRVELRDGGGELVLSRDVDTPQVVVSASELALVAGGGGRLRVAQMSDVFGPGHWADLTLA